MKKLVISRYSLPSRPLAPVVKTPNRVAQDATLSIRTIANHYVRGLMDGINVHPNEFSTELTPLRSKGIDLCDFTSIHEFAVQAAKKAEDELKTQTLQVLKSQKKKTKPDDVSSKEE